MSDQTITFLILAASVVLFVSNRFPVGVVALGVALSLWATDVLTIDQAVAGFGSTTVVLIAALFVVAEALDAAGITTWANRQLVERAGSSQSRLLILIMLVVALLSALITPNGSVAAMTPMVVVLALRFGASPSSLLMPTAFAASAGALLVLTGSPVSILVSEAAHDAGAGHLGYFEVALVGLPLLIGTILVSILLAFRVLPKRDAQTLSRDLSDLPRQLQRQYFGDDHLARAVIGIGSPFVGQMPYALSIGEEGLVHLIAVETEKGRPVVNTAIAAGNQFVLRGAPQVLTRFADANDLAIITSPDDDSVSSGIVSKEIGVAEAMIAPRSGYIGKNAFPGMVTESGELVVLGIARHGVPVSTADVELLAGDALLLQGSWQALDRHLTDPNVIVVDSPEAIRRQTIALGPKAIAALAIVGAMIVLLVSGLVPAVVACLLAALAMVLANVLQSDQAHRAINWSTLLLVGGMIPLSTAITDTGAADTIADHFVDIVGGHGETVVLIGLFLVTAILGQMISNTATALVLIPVALSIAAEMNISPMALLMCVNVAASASLLSPVATPANLMVMEPGGYKFGDYPKLGLPVMAVWFLVAVFLIPIIWPL